MSIMKINIICNFTDSPGDLPGLEFHSARRVDLSGVSGTSGYCSDTAEEEIRRKLKDLPPSGTHYLDDGNHHYMTLFFLEKITVPFDLVVWDHHTDMQPPALLPFLSCGNWILESMKRLPLLKEVWIIGPPAQAMEAVGARQESIHFIDEERANTDVPVIPQGRPVYLSADLDVLAETEYRTAWDQGSMTWERLMEWIRAAGSVREVIGTDFCG